MFPTPFLTIQLDGAEELNQAKGGRVTVAFNSWYAKPTAKA